MATAITTMTACSAGSDKTVAGTVTDQATPTTVSGPALAENAPNGAAVNAPYWKSNLEKLDPKTQEFSQFYATKFCEKSPKALQLELNLISLGQGLGTMKYEYAFWSNAGEPAWGNDTETQKTIAYYIVSNYCPEAPE